MSASERDEWEAIYRLIEPFGDVRGDYQAAGIAQAMHEMWRGRTTRSRRLTDFLLKFDAEPRTPRKPQTVAEQKGIMDAMKDVLDRKPRRRETTKG